MKLWTLNKLIVLALIGAFLTLMFELRFQHQEVLGEHTIAWTPIVYSGLMVITSLAALFLWERGGRQILFWAFAVALVVGTVGFWQHNEEHFGQRIAGVFTVWGNSAPEHHSDENADGSHGAENEGGEHSDESKNGEHSTGGGDEHQADHHQKEESLLPPVFAPLTFAGLGILGMLACARRFQRENLPSGRNIE